MPGYPNVIVTEEGPREGMQIEEVSITTDQKLELIDALSDTGLKRIVVGAFVSPKWTPQMADIDTLVRRLRPRPGVTYLALALNEKGRERMRQHSPPLTVERGVPETHGHMCDVFIRRNTNKTIEEQIAGWPSIVKRAVDAGVPEAGIGLSAPWGSNWRGAFSFEQRLSQLQQQWDLWDASGVAVTQLTFADPMGWNTPHRVAADLRAIKERWPAIRRYRLHLHNARGLALTSIYAALTTLGPDDTLEIDSTIAGIGGCPYCGNGRITGMAPTEDLVQMLEEMGIDTGIDLYKLVEAAWVAQAIIGRPLYGHVSNAGPLPYGRHLYPVAMPRVETAEQAQHYRLGPAVYEGMPCPWDKTGDARAPDPVA
jgi:hydroxymethylglutaryl-CoA lyase